MADMTDQEIKDKILEHLANVPGKGVEVPSRIISALAINRRNGMKIMRALEEEGKIQSAGAAAGVIGYKLTK